MDVALAPLLASAVIGFLLGCLGGGGSILAVPMLIFVAGLPVPTAVGTSLAMIGTASLLASLAHRRRGRVRLDAALAFGLPGAATAWLGAQLTHFVAEAVLISALAAVMLAVGGWALLAKAGPQRPAASSARAQPQRLPASILAGAGVGLLTGFLGVGGGFLVVPALVTFAGLSLRDAIGTSLLVIAVSSVAGFLSHLGEGYLEPSLLAALTLATALGALGGERASRLLPARKLRRGFGWVVLVTGLIVAAAGLARWTERQGSPSAQPSSSDKAWGFRP